MGRKSDSSSSPGGMLRISPRERQILDLIATGSGDKEVARRLGISAATVRTYLQRLYLRAGVHSRTAAVMAFLATRLHDDAVREHG